MTLLASVIGETHMIHPAKGAIILEALTNGRGASSEIFADVDWEGGVAESLRQEARSAPYRVENGIAIISVVGVLTHKSYALRPLSGMTGYDGLRASLNNAEQDASVRGILLNIDSPGGAVTGLFEASDFLHALSTPTVAYVDAMACSAAYILASACDVIIATPSATLGSIGAMCVHVDQSAHDAQVGVAYTLVHSGAHKVDGNPHAPLPDAVREKTQSKLDAVRKQAAERIGARRVGRFDAQAALDTEAQVYDASEALALGMIDQIAQPDFALQAAEQFFFQQSEETMTDSTKSVEAGAAPAPDAVFTEADVQNARLEGATVERERIALILDCDEARGRESTARALARDPHMTAEKAAGILATIPKAATPGTGNSSAILAALDADGGTGVGAQSISDAGAPEYALL